MPNALSPSASNALFVPRAVPAWKETPVEALNGETPAELIRRGEQRKVERLVSELEDPGAI